MKDELRRKYQEIRKTILDKKFKDEIICKSFLNSKIYKESDVILAYYPLEEEIDIKEVIVQAFLDNKKVALPVTLNKMGDMDFYFITNLADLKIGNFGIKEPKNLENKVNDFKKTVILVPGIAMDKEGYRLGFGKGYYDRFLNMHTVYSVGLCYRECLVDKLPIYISDKRVEMIISD